MSLDLRIINKLRYSTTLWIEPKIQSTQDRAKKIVYDMLHDTKHKRKLLEHIFGKTYLQCNFCDTYSMVASKFGLNFYHKNQFLEQLKQKWIHYWEQILKIRNRFIYIVQTKRRRVSEICSIWEEERENLIKAYKNSDKGNRKCNVLLIYDQLSL